MPSPPRPAPRPPTRAQTPLRVLVAEDREEDRYLLLKYLDLLGHQVVGVAETGGQLAELCHDARPDVVVADVKMPDVDGAEASVRVNEDPGYRVPFVLVSAHDDGELLARAPVDHVFAYLVKPVTGSQLKAALALARQRFEQFLALQKEAADLRQALEDRKLVERAKGALMRRVGVGEEEAFRRLKKLSSEQNRKLAEVARAVLRAEATFAELDRLR